MKKALLFLFLAAGTQQLKAQRQSIPDNLPYTLQITKYKPLLTDTNYSALLVPKAKNNTIGTLAVPNLQKPENTALLDQLLAESSTHYSHMPIARTQSADNMPTYHAPDSVHYHMLISKPKRASDLVKVNP